MKKTVCICILAAALCAGGCSPRMEPEPETGGSVITGDRLPEASYKDQGDASSFRTGEGPLLKTPGESASGAGSQAQTLEEPARMGQNSKGENAVSSEGDNPELSSTPSDTEKENTPESSAGPGGLALPEGDWTLLLVNSENPIGAAYEPELAEVQNGYRMDARVAPVMRQMILDARSQGVELLVCSAYRPYASQERNFNAKVQEYKTLGYSDAQAREATLRLIAAPGASEHHTGLSADIVTPAYQGLDDGYANTAAAKWLLENASSYGFILRYPKDKTGITGIDFEPWHYRYVGKKAAREIMSQGVCLEEYLA